jgi:hypothetical protein
MWFEQLKFFFTGKELDFAIDQTLEEYAAIAAPIPTPTSADNKSGISTPTSDISHGFAKLSISSDKLTAVMNIEKAAKYKAASAKIMFIINKCIDELDREFVRSHDNAKGRWDMLWKKYSVLTAQAKREDLQQITGFKYGKDKDGKDIDMSIDSAWTTLVAVRGRIVTANPKLAESFDEATLLDYLMAGLPENFNTTRQTLDSNPNLGVYNKLEILQKIETQYGLTAKAETETANIATKQSREKHRSRLPKDRIRCYFCGERHVRSKCELRTLLTAMVADFHLNKARSELKDQPKGRSKPDARKGGKSNHYSGKRRDKGLVADGDDDNSSGTEQDSSSESEDSQEDEDDTETCNFSKDKIADCKIPESDWCADTGCTSHMTDKPTLFRGPMVKIRRRTVKVGGGRLYADFMGTVEMKVAGVSLLLENVLHVPSLDANLLSSRKICADWKCLGVFDDKSMWFISDSKQVILQAKVTGGLYIVSRIVPNTRGVQSSALLADLGDNTDSTRFNPFYRGNQDGECCHTAMTADENDDIALDEHSYPDNPNDSKRLRKFSQKENLARYRLMHRRFAHLGPEKLRNLHKVTTLKRPILVPTDREMCRVCKLTKLRNRTSKVLSPWKESILALISIDVAGPFLPTIRGNRWFAQVVDNATRKTWTLVAKTKAEVMKKLEKWKETEEQRTHMRIGAVRSDNASEIREKLDEWSKLGVIEEPTTTYTGSHQNGVAERSIQQAETDARAMLKDADLPLEFWDWAVEADSYVRNRTPGGPLVDGIRLSPEEAYTGDKPSIDYIRVFGSICYSYISPKSLPSGTVSKKLMDTGREGVFVGYNHETTKQLCVYAPDLGYAIMTSILDVDEEKQGGSLDLKIRKGDPQGTSAESFISQGTSSAPPQRRPAGRPRNEELIKVVSSIPTQRNNFDIVIPPIQKALQFEGPLKVKIPDSIVPTQGEGPDKAKGPEQPPLLVPTSKTIDRANRDQSTKLEPRDTVMTGTEGNHARFPLFYGENQPTALTPTTTATREKRTYENDDMDTRKAKRQRAFHASEIHALIAQRIYELEGEVEESAFIAAGGTVDITIPKGYDEAINDPDHGAEWQSAIEEEIQSLVANGTWKEEKAPKGSNLVSTKWVFTIKTNADGSLERYKARLVARGFSQVYGEDYTDTFAPTVRTDTLRIFFAMVAANDLECRTYDIKNAFTESSLKERIFLSAPKGVPVTPGYVLRVLRSLYGLKQSARDWNMLCKSELKKLGFRQSLADPCLFTHAERQIVLLVYVDDIAAAAKSNDDLFWFFDNFRRRFNTKDLGEISKILGIHVTRNRKQRELFIDQAQYLEEKVLQRIGLPLESSSTSKPRLIPVSGRYDKLEAATPEEERTNTTEYQQKIGSIMYAMVYTRPDIAFHIGQLSQQMKDPAVRHNSAVKELGRYLRTTIRQKIRYGPTEEAFLKVYEPDLGANLALYSDADWANMKGRKSISGYVAMLYGGPVAWGSKKQRSVSTSSCESEYIGMSTCCKQGQWIAQVLRDMGFPQYIGKDPRLVDMRADNQGAIALAKNPHLHERSKHIDISYHHIRDLEERNKLKITYVPTAEMVADGFTKPLEKIAFAKFKGMLGLVDKTT